MINRDRLAVLLPLILVLAAALAWRAGAGTAAARQPAEPTSVATIDIVEIFDKLNERAVLEADLKARNEARQSTLDESKKILDAIRADLDPDTGTLKPGTDAHRERVREFMEQQAVAEARTAALRQIVSIDQGTLQRQLYQKVAAAVAKVAARDGVDIVLFDDSLFPIHENEPSENVYRSIITKSVIYRNASADITQRVITLMNNEYTAP